MTVYNINLGIGWASSGVEYAQAYRAKIFQEMVFQMTKLSGSITILQMSKSHHLPSN